MSKVDHTAQHMSHALQKLQKRMIDHPSQSLD